jgi:hypothetical protein
MSDKDVRTEVEIDKDVSLVQKPEIFLATRFYPLS